jgi:hypothetical protein
VLQKIIFKIKNSKKRLGAPSQRRPWARTFSNMAPSTLSPSWTHPAQISSRKSRQFFFVYFLAQKTTKKLDRDTRACSSWAQASPALRAFDGEAVQARQLDGILDTAFRAFSKLRDCRPTVKPLQKYIRKENLKNRNMGKSLS